MLYLVEVRASMERGNKIDGEKGPGPVFAKIMERFSSRGILCPLSDGAAKRMSFMATAKAPYMLQFQHGNPSAD